ncbi:hypothetical protein V866_001933 [Kwoniella sp. B9012]
MRDPPSSREWQDYYDNQKTYIPPSCPTPTPRYPRAHSPPTSPRRSSSSFTTAREQGSRWNLFEGMTIYVHPIENESPHDRRRWDLMDKIRCHGGSLSLRPHLPHVTTILIPFPPTYPRYTVLLIRPSETPIIKTKGWTRDELVQLFARVSSTDHSPVYPYGRKRVLRVDWAEECLRDGRLRGENESWGGWEVRATTDPKLVNDENTYRTHSSDFGYNQHQNRSDSPVAQTRIQTSPGIYTSPLKQVENLAQDPRKYLRARAEQSKGTAVEDREKTIWSDTDERRNSQEEAKTDETQEEVSISIEEPLPKAGTDATDLSGSKNSQRDRLLHSEDIQIDEVRESNGEHVEQSQANGMEEPDGVDTTNRIEDIGASGQDIIIDIDVKEETGTRVKGDNEVRPDEYKDEKESQPTTVKVKVENGDSKVQQGESKIEETEDGTEGNGNELKENQNEEGINENKIEDQKNGTADIKPVIIDEDEEPFQDDACQGSLRSQSRSGSRRSSSFSKRDTSIQGPCVPSARSSASEASTRTAVSLPRAGRPSSIASISVAVPRMEQKVFIRGALLPYTFCVLGEGREKRFTEMIITNGGGLIASSESATFLIVLLSPDQNISLPEDHPEVYRMVKEMGSEPGRRVISVDWVEDCKVLTRKKPYGGCLAP